LENIIQTYSETQTGKVDILVGIYVYEKDLYLDVGGLMKLVSCIQMILICRIILKLGNPLLFS
jgi:hypothetical protein